MSGRKTDEEQATNKRKGREGFPSRPFPFNSKAYSAAFCASTEICTCTSSET